MPSPTTPVQLNRSDFWQQHCENPLIRASSSFRVPKSTVKSVIFTDAELSELQACLPLSRQIHPRRTPPPYKELPLVRTSRSIELEIMKRELHTMESTEATENKQYHTIIKQRNQLLKINAGLANYIAHNHSPQKNM
tara:strand:- start:120 stop:530 length:411 start_codon:yes stop_codon:yes gene_type:complete